MNAIVTDVEKIVKDGLVVTVGGKSYSAAHLSKVCDTRNPEDIELQTLTGLADYIETNIDSLNKKELLIVVDNHETVTLNKALNAETQQRFNYVSVSLNKKGKQFPFGQFLSVEEFIIKLQSMFQMSQDLTTLLNFVSRLTINDSLSLNDDGISQTATVKTGISGALKEAQIAPARVLLVPNRIFSEVDQPKSLFLFRMRTSEGKIPSCALFEADGGAWINEAMENIKEWLIEKIPEVAVIA